jgi:hypothetical protein
MQDGSDKKEQPTWPVVHISSWRDYLEGGGVYVKGIDLLMK